MNRKCVSACCHDNVVHANNSLPVYVGVITVGWLTQYQQHGASAWDIKHGTSAWDIKHAGERWRVKALADL